MVARTEHDQKLLTRYRLKYASSPVPDVPVDAPWFDAVLGVVEREIMDLPDGVNFKPDAGHDGPGVPGHHREAEETVPLTWAKAPRGAGPRLRLPARRLPDPIDSGSVAFLPHGREVIDLLQHPKQRVVRDRPVEAPRRTPAPQEGSWRSEPRPGLPGPGPRRR